MICMISISLVLVILQVAPTFSLAGEHKQGDKHYSQHEIRKKQYDYDDHNRGQDKENDKGNEVTGQAGAWVLVSANLTVLFSLMMKGANRFLPLAPQTKNSITRYNRFQKKYLMRFHYVLNPLALCIAFFHFLLSTCRSSPLPEWGLLLVTLMVVLGLMLKLRVSPGWMRRGVSRFHTSFAAFSAVILVLVVGHLMVD